MINKFKSDGCPSLSSPPSGGAKRLLSLAARRKTGAASLTMLKSPVGATPSPTSTAAQLQSPQSAPTTTVL